MRDESRTKLEAVSVATITTVLLKHGLRNTFIGGIGLINPMAPRLVGPAYTLRYIPARRGAARCLPSPRLPRTRVT